MKRLVPEGSWGIHLMSGSGYTSKCNPRSSRKLRDYSALLTAHQFSPLFSPFPTLASSYLLDGAGKLCGLTWAQWLT